MRAPSIALALIGAVVGLSAPSAWAVVGDTPGTFAISSRGAATYSVPIVVPNGPQGVQPRLSLVYNSQAGGGYLGQGWSLGGLSAITRCGATFAQDGTPAAISLTYNDRFCLDGSKLRLTSSSVLTDYGLPGTTYQTELANFANVTANSATGNGPTSFTVRGKDGLTYEYGNGGNSTVSSNGSITLWMLSKVSDRSGNSMTIAYRAQDANIVGIAVPETISWTPTTQGATTYKYTMAFSYNPTSTAIAAGYVAGNQAKLASILFGIKIQSGSTTVKNYVFDYASIAPAFHLTLTSLKECSDAAGNNCLAPTTFAYQPTTAGVPTPVTPSGSGPTLGGTINTADFNNDGKADLIFATASGSNFQWWVQLSTGSGFGAPISTGAVTPSANSVLLADFNGKGGAQILAPSSNLWVLYRLNGTSFTSASTGLSVTAAATYSAADVNGDGLADLVHVLTAFDYNLRVQLNTSSAGTVSFVTTPVVTSVPGKDTTCFPPFQPCPSYTVISLFGNNQWRYSSTKIFDFDGDGRQDLLLYSSTLPSGGVRTYSVMTLLSRGSGPFSASMVVPVGDDHNQIQPVNWNDDACTDLEIGLKVYISACNGASGSTVTLATSAFLSLDWNADGRSDLINQTSSGYGFGLSTGTGISEGPLSVFTIGGGSTVLDLDGDGLDDVACTCGTSSAINYGVHGGAGLKPDVMTSVTDGYGNNSSPQYVSIAQGSYTKGDPSGTPATFPEQDIQPPLFVVKQVTATDGTGGTYTQTYSYAGLRKNTQGRGIEGFLAMTASDSRTDSPVSTTSYATAFPHTGFVTAADVSQHGGAPLISHTVYTLDVKPLDTTANNQRTFPYVKVSRTEAHEVGGSKDGEIISTSETTNTPDESGNPTNSVSTLTDNDSNSPNFNQVWTRTVATTYAPNTANWCLGALTAQTITLSATGVTAITRSMSQTVDFIKCRPTQQIIEPGTSLYAVTNAIGYDEFGNVNSVTVTGSGMSGRTTAITWSDATHPTGQFPLSRTDALGHTETMSHDYDLGVRLTSTGPNNLTTSFQYDAFGRNILETRPDGTKSARTLNLCSATPGVCPSPSDLRYWLQVIEQTTSGGAIHESRLFFDGLDRPRFVQGQSLDGSFVYETHREYDALGRVSREFEPAIGESAPYHAITYDGAGRPKLDQLFINGVVDRQSSVAYTGRTTTFTDALGKQSVKVANVAGQLFRSADHDGYGQTFTHDAFGSLTNVTDSLGNGLFSASYVYGASAFVTSKTDMDLGTLNYTPNALGEIVSYRDAKNVQFDFTFDALSRPLTRSEPGDGTTTWTWGNTAASHNIGRLERVDSTGYSEIYTYDQFGRPIKKRIVSDATYDFDTAYESATGLISTLTYPTTPNYQLQVQYLYQFGLPKQIKDAATGNSFWTANAVNARGQLTQETLGNGVVTTRQIDPATGFLSSIQSGVGGGASLQNEAYLYDLVGNLAQRQNNALSLTETFSYDNLHRLTQSTVGADTNLAVAYDLMGNITSRRYVGSYSYDPAKKHAVVSAGAVTYGYDANGNMNSISSAAGTSSITWTSFNQPRLVSSPGGNSSQFSYDFDHQRWKQEASYAGVSETTVYIGGLMEKTTIGTATDFKHYIQAGDATVLYVRRSNGTSNTYFITQDHLTSTSVVTCGSDVTGCPVGTVLFKESFASFGSRRANNWQCGPSPSDMNFIAATTRHGFTTHEALDNLKLINMNGRLYNPIIARFLSPDPQMTDPGNTQNYNRYSYVLNNPLRYTDPTGFSDNEPWVIFIFIGPSFSIPHPNQYWAVPQLFDPYKGPPSFAEQARLFPGVPREVWERGESPTLLRSPLVTEGEMALRVGAKAGEIMDSATDKFAEVVGPYGDKAVQFFLDHPMYGLGTLWGIQAAAFDSNNAKHTANMLILLGTLRVAPAEALPVAAREAEVLQELGTVTGSTKASSGSAAPGSGLFRGGNSLNARLGVDVKPAADGLIHPLGKNGKPQGLSLNVDPKDPFIQKYGGAFPVDTIPEGLQVMQSGRAGHYVIAPASPMTFERYQELLGEVKLGNFNIVP